MSCTWLAGNTGRKKSPFWHSRTTMSGHIFGTKACMYRQSEKNLLNSNTSSTCPANMVNFGLLTGRLRYVGEFGAPLQIFNGFRVLAELLHGTLVVSVCQTAALNRWRYLYSAGRPSRWALAHISRCLILQQ